MLRIFVDPTTNHFLINGLAKENYVSFYINRVSNRVHPNNSLDMPLQAVAWNSGATRLTTDYFLVTNDQGTIFEHVIDYYENKETIAVNHKKVYKHSEVLKDIAVFY